MLVRGTAGLYFFQPVTTINGAKYLDLLRDKLEIHIMALDCNVFMHNGAPCHREKSGKNLLLENNTDILDRPGNIPDQNSIENLWHMMKNEVANEHPTSIELLKTAIKII